MVESEGPDGLDQNVSARGVRACIRGCGGGERYVVGITVQYRGSDLSAGVDVKRAEFAYCRGGRGSGCDGT